MNREKKLEHENNVLKIKLEHMKFRQDFYLEWIDNLQKRLKQYGGQNDNQG